jgi:urease accessory protein
MTTSTRTERAAVLAVTRGGVARLRRGDRLAPRIIGSNGRVHATLLATQAGPLAGDADRVVIEVGAGAALELSPVAATVALGGSARTELTTEVTVHAGGRLVLDEPALVVCDGAAVCRRTLLRLGPGAVAAVREAVVLGRTGERGGAVAATLRVTTLDGAPLLHDELRLDGPAPADRVALPPGHRTIVTAALLGTRPPGAEDLHELRPACRGALRRATARSLADAQREVAAAWERYALAAVPHGRGP